MFSFEVSKNTHAVNIPFLFMCSCGMLFVVQVRRVAQNCIVVLLEEEKGNRGLSTVPLNLMVVSSLSLSSLSLFSLSLSLPLSLPSPSPSLSICLSLSLSLSPLPPSWSTDVLLTQLCPTVKRCLGRDENYDLRMDTALVNNYTAMCIW